MKIKVGKYEIELPDNTTARSFVHFDIATGHVSRISNFINETDTSVLEVDFERVKSYINGEISLINLKVEFDPEIRDFVLIESGEELSKKSTDRVYQIYKTDKADIVLVLDKPNQCWKVLVDPDIRSSILNKNVVFDSIMGISVTVRNNPHLLLRTLSIPLDRLFREAYFVIPFDHEFEFTLEEFSLFTPKRFDSYSCEVIE